MGKDILQEEFQVLEELIRTATSLISPLSIHHTLKKLMDPETRISHYKKHPKCFLALGIGSKSTLFPICNMSGVEDIEVIAFSLKLADRLYARKDVNGDQLNIIVKRLKKLQKKFSQSTPKPANMSHLKAKATMKMDDILNRIK